MTDESTPLILVLLVDDQPIIHEAIRAMLRSETDMEVHACADPTEAIRVADRLAPTIILIDLVMPEVDGLTLLKFFRANPSTHETPMIVLSSREEPPVQARAFSLGANDYLVKLPDPSELIARIRHHARCATHLMERNRAYAQLEEQRRRMVDQIAAAAVFVHSLLPNPLDGPLRIRWAFAPSANLGGDTFGYHWIDDNHFAIYLLDVAGHGIDAALYAVTVMNILRSQTLRDTDFRNPAQVLTVLNDAFPMERYGDRFFTIWYGVYNQGKQTLRWSGGGHPAALLFNTAMANDALVRLDSQGPMLGIMPGRVFSDDEVAIAAGSRLYVYSDGVHEIHRPNGTMWKPSDFENFLIKSGHDVAPHQLLEHVRQLHGSELLDDDFSMLEITFPK